MSVDQGQLYRFGGFVLDTNENVLLSEGKPVSISPKALHLLSVLVADHGRIVEKERLMSEVWADSFVEDSNLTFTIRKLRQALGDDAHQPKFIETVPRRGYRFVAQVDLDGEYRAEPDPIVDEAALPSEVLVIDARPSPGMRKGLSRRPLVRAGLIGVVLLVLLGIGYGVFRLIRGNAPAMFGEAEVTRLTSHGNVQAAAISPDGKFIVYTLNENTRHSLWLKNIANGGSAPIELPSEMAFITNLIFAPDGNSVYFGHHTSLYRFPIPAGVPTKVLDQYRGGDYNAITFSPDGKQFAFLSFGVDAEGDETASIIVYDTTLSSERVLATSKRPALFLRSAAWSPDGKIVACAALNEKGNQEIVGVRVADGAVLSVPSPVWATVRQIVWQPDGKGLFVIGENDDSGFLSQLFSLSFPHGDAKNITTDLNDYQSVSGTKDGQTLVAVRAQQESHIWVTDAEDSKKIRRLTTGFQKFDGVYGINWTREGKIIYETAPSGKIEIWSINSDGTEARRLAAEGGSMGASPDGRYLIFQAYEDGVAGFFRLDWNQGERRRITSGTDLDPAFTPDGKAIVFTRYADDVALWKLGIDGGEPGKLTGDGDMLSVPAFSPDGSQIAVFRQKMSGKVALFLSVVDAKTGETVKDFPYQQTTSMLGHNKKSIQWSDDSKALDYVRSSDGVSNIWRQPLDGSPPFQVTAFDTDLIFNFATSLDGKRYAFSRGSYDRDVFSIVSVK